jgi:hypothetical protein
MMASMHLLPPQEPADPLAPGPFALADGARLRRILQNAGFSRVRIDPFDGPMNMGASAEEAAAEALNIGPLSRAANGLDDDTRAKIREVVAAAYAKFVSPAGVMPPAACWLAHASSE